MCIQTVVGRKCKILMSCGSKVLVQSQRRVDILYAQLKIISVNILFPALLWQYLVKNNSNTFIAVQVEQQL